MDERIERTFDQERSVTRRSFLSTVLGLLTALVAGAIGLPVFRYIVPPKRNASAAGTVLAGAEGELQPNFGKIFPIGNKPGILIRTPDGELRAFTAICTHLGCTVQYRSDLEHIWCACHNGHFDLLGRNISGPPPRPLDQYDVGVIGGKVYATVKS